MTRILPISLAFALLWATPARAEPNSSGQFTITLHVIYHPRVDSVQVRSDGRTEAILNAIDDYHVKVDGGRQEPTPANGPWKSTKIVADEGVRIVTVTLTPKH